MRIIAGEWGGRRLAAPPGRDVRPTTDRVRESWFSILGDTVRDARVLDLFAGSGALGLEALSRGAREAVFVERSNRVASILEKNIRDLGAGARATVVRGDAMRYVERLGPVAFDLALADPPYDRGFAQQLLRQWSRVPFARVLWVEHRSSETVDPLPGLEQRRYGDTILSGIEFSTDSHVLDGEGS